MDLQGVGVGMVNTVRIQCMIFSKKKIKYEFEVEKYLSLINHRDLFLMVLKVRKSEISIPNTI